MLCLCVSLMSSSNESFPSRDFVRRECGRGLIIGVSGGWNGWKGTKSLTEIEAVLADESLPHDKSSCSVEWTSHRLSGIRL